MAEFGPLKALTEDQADASYPRAHRWVSASAGTGKTAVLSARVLRLLLQGVAPERILCLTFTKAGAAEMAERVHSRLAHWVQIPDRDLRKELFALGEANDDAAIARARLLFADVLEATGGGLRIQTIHSFCQSLLAAFPLEAGLVPGFRPLDDRGQTELSRAALIAMLERAGRDGDAAVLAAIEMLALKLGEQGTLAYLARCVPAARALDALPEEIAPFLLAFLDLPEGDVETVVAQACADAAFPVGMLRQVAAANREWDTATGSKVVEAVEGWLAGAPEGRAAGLEALFAAILTQKGEVKNRGNAKLLAAQPDYVALGEGCGAAIRRLLDLRRQVAFAHRAAQALTAGRAYARAYAQAKRQAGAVDFDDLIGRASDLLTRAGMAEWIRYKLDQQIDHVLVDEAQDTNKAQWDIVWSIAGEFLETEPEGGERVHRTMFVVGDTKQAIFGFQGTSPDAFLDAFREFRDAAERADHPFRDLPLRLSFRSVPAVLETVDAVIDHLGAAAFGLDAPPARHGYARAHPGRVLLLPPTSVRPMAEDDLPESDPAEGDEDWLADHQRRHAERIAQMVKGWLDPAAPLWLESQGRAARAGDVLILLRSRSALSRLIVARLYEAGVPVAGVDRLRLQAPLAVRDLLAALRFAVQPEDDLNLANLLVSPLIGWGQDQLMRRAIGREKASLWNHLRATLEAAEQAPLRALLALADLTTPYRYLETILSGAMDGRRKLVARLGEEARDAIDELLNAALAFEADDHPSLQRFIDWFDRGDADIKRELAETGDMVRVMTVHGAKGLEAPVVILADAAFDPALKPRADAVALPLTDKASLPLPRPAADETGERIAAAMAAADRIEAEEHWRLLYVALTRAQEQLVVTGALGPRARGVVPEASWHGAVEAAMRALGAQPAALDPWGEGLLWAGRDRHPAAKARTQAAAEASEAIAPPAWLRQPAPVESRPPRPLAPSAAIEDDVPDPPPDAAMRRAAERGRLLHALFERLPDLPPSERAEAARRWLARAGTALEEGGQAALVAHAMAVLDDPAHAALFGSQALAEAPIAAVVEGQVIAGTVDRLLVTDDLVHLVDFKTGRRVPAGVDDAPLAHVRQMAAYAAALEAIFPGRPQRVSLLYTAAPRLIDLPPALLDAHKPRFAAQEHFLSGDALEAGQGAD